MIFVFSRRSCIMFGSCSSSEDEPSVDRSEAWIGKSKPHEDTYTRPRARKPKGPRAGRS